MLASEPWSIGKTLRSLTPLSEVIVSSTVKIGGFQVYLPVTGGLSLRSKCVLNQHQQHQEMKWHLFFTLSLLICVTITGN